MTLLNRLSKLPRIDILRELDARQLAAGRTRIPQLPRGGPCHLDLVGIDEDTLIATGKLERIRFDLCHYGVDNRLEVTQATLPEHQAAAASVVAVMPLDGLERAVNGAFTVKTGVFGRQHGLCPSERFWLQPASGAIMTGVLVGKNIVATAAHKLKEANLKDYCFVRDWRMVDSATPPLTTVAASDVFYPDKIIKREYTTAEADWMLIRLTGSTNNYVSKLLKTRIPDRQPVYVIGHPYGLPAKFADGAIVRDNTPSHHFVTNLDTYGHNSGSPVFDALDHSLVGIVVRGKPDFIYNSECGCRISFVVGDNAGRGEDCTRVTEFTHLL